MKKITTMLFLAQITCYSMALQAKTVRLLFVGNSYLYYPATPDNPALPKMFKQFAESSDPDLNISYHHRTVGGSTMKRHFDEGVVHTLLKNNQYDYVVLQGQSAESLELTPYINKEYGLKGRPEFLHYSGKLISVVKENGATPIMFAHWIRHKDNVFRAENHPALHFPIGHPKAGQKWTGESDREYQNKINEGYRLAMNPSSLFAWVGEMWLQALSANEVIKKEDLYNSDNHHPIEGGTYLAVCELYKRIFNKSPLGVSFRPNVLSKEKATFLQNIVHTHSPDEFDSL